MGKTFSRIILRAQSVWLYNPLGDHRTYSLVESCTGNWNARNFIWSSFMVCEFIPKLTTWNSVRNLCRHLFLRLQNVRRRCINPIFKFEILGSRKSNKKWLLSDLLCSLLYEIPIFAFSVTHGWFVSKCFRFEVGGFGIFGYVGRWWLCLSFTVGGWRSWFFSVGWKFRFDFVP